MDEFIAVAKTTDIPEGQAKAFSVAGREIAVFHHQGEFYALDVAHPEVYPTPDAQANLMKPGLDVAEADGTLEPIGSVYSPENDVVHDGVHRNGPRLVTFAHVLKSNLFPLADILRLLLDIGMEGMACPIEIEFAVDMSKDPMRFGFLQIRPIICLLPTVTGKRPVNNDNIRKEGSIQHRLDVITNLQSQMAIDAGIPASTFESFLHGFCL